MKQKILTLLIIALMLFPMGARAESKYESMNLEQILTQEGIEHDLSKYKETEQQAIIYLFRGHGCDYCKSFLKFLNTIIDEYGKYFRVVSYEVWENGTNGQLLDHVAETLDVRVEGVPFIVIGDKYFPGYGEAYDEDIKKAIMDQYNSKEKYDILEEVDKFLKKSKTGTNSAEIIVWNFVFIVIATTIILIVHHRQYKRLEEKIEQLKPKTKKS